jgi:hypothetical protein
LHANELYVSQSTYLKIQAKSYQTWCLLTAGIIDEYHIAHEQAMERSVLLSNPPPLNMVTMALEIPVVIAKRIFGIKYNLHAACANVIYALYVNFPLVIALHLFVPLIAIFHFAKFGLEGRFKGMLEIVMAAKFVLILLCMIPFSPLLFIYYVFNHKSAREKQGERIAARKARRRKKWNLETAHEQKGDKEMRRMMNGVNDKNMARLYAKKKLLVERLTRIDSNDSGVVTWQQFWSVMKHLNQVGEQFQQKALDRKSTIALTQMQQLAQIQHLAEHRAPTAGQMGKKNTHERRQWSKIKNSLDSIKRWAEVSTVVQEAPAIEDDTKKEQAQQKLNTRLRRATLQYQGFAVGKKASRQYAKQLKKIYQTEFMKVDAAERLFNILVTQQEYRPTNQSVWDLPSMKGQESMLAGDQGDGRRLSYRQLNFRLRPYVPRIPITSVMQAVSHQSAASTVKMIFEIQESMQVNMWETEQLMREQHREIYEELYRVEMMIEAVKPKEATFKNKCDVERRVDAMEFSFNQQLTKITADFKEILDQREGIMQKLVRAHHLLIISVVASHYLSHAREG